jgi:hypothetical protein
MRLQTTTRILEPQSPKRQLGCPEPGKSINMFNHKVLPLCSKKCPEIPCSLTHQIPVPQGQSGSYHHVYRQNGQSLGALDERMLGAPQTVPSGMRNDCSCTAASTNPFTGTIAQICPPSFVTASLMQSLLWTPLSHLTMYVELSSAQEDAEFQRVHMRLQQEWIAMCTSVSLFTYLTFIQNQ